MAQVGLLEDNARIAKLCATMLHYAGYQVTVYRHPRECLNALLPHLEAIDNTYSVTLATPPALPVDILILDLHLPDIDGLEVLRELCAYPPTQSLPLIFCTAAAPAEIAYAMKMAPHAGFVEKPFTYEELTSAIKIALGARDAC